MTHQIGYLRMRRIDPESDIPHYKIEAVTSLSRLQNPDDEWLPGIEILLRSYIYPDFYLYFGDTLYKMSAWGYADVIITNYNTLSYRRVADPAELGRLMAILNREFQ